MPVFLLGSSPIFPDPSLSDPDGLVAVGGDLSVERLLNAYRMGIFPWYSEGQPIMWWSPDPRLVLFPDELKVSRSLRQTIKKGIFNITFDRAFGDVMRACANIRRPGQDGTWITRKMIKAYAELHELGYAHSVEAWSGGKIAGGLYGVSVGRAFFGESMFSLKPDASKAALVALVQKLREAGCAVIDCQVETKHLKSMGAREITRAEFLKILRETASVEET